MSLQKIVLKNSKSDIVNSNKCRFSNKSILYVDVCRGDAGLFDKNVAKSARFGEYICKLISKEFSCKGFFTSDELPGYGITEDETKKLYEFSGASENDLIIFYAYPKKLAIQINDVVMTHIGFKKMFGV